MKILIISKRFPPSIDGVGDHSAQIYRRLLKEGHSVKIITSSAPRERDPDIHYSRLSNMSDVFRLASLTRRLKPDRVLFQYVGYSFNRIGAPFWLYFYFLFLKLNRTPLTVIVHETYIRKDHRAKLLIYRYLQKNCLKVLLTLTENLVTNTKLYELQLKSLCKKTILLNLTPSNFEEVLYNDRLVTIQKNTLIISFGARDPKYILQIFQALYNTNNNVSLRFCGKYHERDCTIINKFVCENHLKEHIEVTGELDHRSILEHLAAGDCFLLPESVVNMHEGGLSSKSGSTATAFMLGKPVISTSGDFTDPLIFKSMNNFISIPHDDYREASKILQSILLDRRKLYSIGENGRELYYKYLSWTQYMSKLTNLFNE